MQNEPIHSHSELLVNVDVTALFQTRYLCIDLVREIYNGPFLYSISSIVTFSLSEAKVSSLHDEEESMYEVPQLRRTVSDSGYEKATELSFMSKSTSSDEQVIIVSGRLNMFCFQIQISLGLYTCVINMLFRIFHFSSVWHVEIQNYPYLCLGHEFKP